MTPIPPFLLLTHQVQGYIWQTSPSDHGQTPAILMWKLSSLFCSKTIRDIAQVGWNHQPVFLFLNVVPSAWSLKSQTCRDCPEAKSLGPHGPCHDPGDNCELVAKAIICSQKLLAMGPVAPNRTVFCFSKFARSLIWKFQALHWDIELVQLVPWQETSGLHRS